MALVCCKDGWTNRPAMLASQSISAHCMLCCNVTPGNAMAPPFDAVAWCSCSGVGLRSVSCGGSEFGMAVPA